MSTSRAQKEKDADQPTIHYIVTIYFDELSNFYSILERARSTETDPKYKELLEKQYDLINAIYLKLRTFSIQNTKFKELCCLFRYLISVTEESFSIENNPISLIASRLPTEAEKEPLLPTPTSQTTKQLIAEANTWKDRMHRYQLDALYTPPSEESISVMARLKLAISSAFPDHSKILLYIINDIPYYYRLSLARMFFLAKRNQLFVYPVVEKIANFYTQRSPDTERLIMILRLLKNNMHHTDSIKKENPESPTTQNESKSFVSPCFSKTVSLHKPITLFGISYYRYTKMKQTIISEFRKNFSEYMTNRLIEHLVIHAASLASFYRMLLLAKNKNIFTLDTIISLIKIYRSPIIADYPNLITEKQITDLLDFFEKRQSRKKQPEHAKCLQIFTSEIINAIILNHIFRSDFINLLELMLMVDGIKTLLNTREIYDVIDFFMFNKNRPRPEHYFKTVHETLSSLELEEPTPTKPKLLVSLFKAYNIHHDSSSQLTSTLEKMKKHKLINIPNMLLLQEVADETSGPFKDSACSILWDIVHCQTLSQGTFRELESYIKGKQRRR